MAGILKAPSIGPIVGHTTSHSVRIWMRGNDENNDRTIAIAAIYMQGKPVNEVKYFRLKREYDRTGTVDFFDLFPEMSYEIRVASLSIETTDPLENLEDDEIFSTLPPPATWLKELESLNPASTIASVKTFPPAGTDKLSFIFGSCRYPSGILGKKRADKIFNAILEKITDQKEITPNFFMMVGDQIYADILPKDLGILVANNELEFHQRYHSAFASKNTRNLLKQITTYMILDDHEIEDNWVMGRLHQSGKRSLFNCAIQAYLSYQWIHGPRNFDRLFYTFEAGSFPFFVLDGRTQRIRDDEDYDLSDNHLLGRPSNGSGYPGQIDLLCDWLVAKQKKSGNRPKFIVTASVFVPNEISTAGDSNKNIRNKCQDDAWAAFPNTRDQLLKTITDNLIQNVVFISGDIHCFNTSKIDFADKNGNPVNLNAFSIVSSAFYWPYPFANGNPNDYVHDSRKQNDNFEISNGYTMQYKTSNFVQDNNFCKVDIDWPNRHIRVRSFNEENKLVAEEYLYLH